MPRTKHFDTDAALERAMRLFWARGYEATSMQDLVSGMGVNRASLYGTFGDKRALFIAALERYDARHRRAHLAALERAHPPREAIRALFDGWIALALGETAPSGCFLTNTALELAAHDPEIGRIVAASQRETEAFFRRLIRKAQAHGELSSALDARRMAQTLLAELVGLLVLARSRPEPALLQAIASGALERLH